MRIGTDLIRIRRISEALDRFPGFARLVYTARELQIAASFNKARREQFLAGRFAIKEAVVKALRLGIGDGTVLQQIEALPAEDGSPRIELLGLALETAQKSGLQEFQVNVSHDAGLVIAVVCLS
jgi:holo-[acyl-carrier protein] synthase